MIRIISILIVLSFSSLSFTQEVYQYGDNFGVKYNGVAVHYAKYTKVEITDYFVAGKDELYWYNLSEKGESPEKPYKKFLFHLKDQLLVVGVTLEGKLDVFNETGEFLYMRDGDYDKVKSSFEIAGVNYNSDVLLIVKNGKNGLYNWPNQTEILPAKYDKIKINQDCINGGRMLLFLQEDGQNMVLNAFGEELVKFKNGTIDNIKYDKNCDGYLLERGLRKGFMRQLKSGKYFLIKPIYSDLIFPEDNSDIIICQKGTKYGLYYKNKRILACKYDKIDITDNGYIFGTAVKNLKKLTFDKEGKIVKVEAVNYEDEH